MKLENYCSIGNTIHNVGASSYINSTNSITDIKSFGPPRLRVTGFFLVSLVLVTSYHILKAANNLGEVSHKYKTHFDDPNGSYNASKISF